ncbi:tripartite tricarboxylate transporter substrate binding protein [Ramlibacter sp. CrO1]|uniref:Tripartite tricarboxylate transporter substrate binding protein n=2 Tax=Ramlibacter algicola TaxID=2795217 RepID=A0A934Q622_9BURK|nr:tripartite tricarboxylate transporter substrate binding protein [Ramlibacter algicola]
MTELVTRRHALLGLAASAMALPFPAAAQQDRPLKLIVPFSAGGTADVLPRLLGEKLRTAYPGGVVIENKPGAGGNIGADFVFRSEPDGFTLLASPPGPVAINQNLYRKLSFEPARWVPVTVIATVPNVLAVSNKLPVQNVGELIAHLKANPGKVSVASQGNGSTSHLTAAMFMQLTGTEMNHIPYKGTAPALVDLLGGNVDVFFDNLSSSAPHQHAGKLRILAVADDQRSRVLPQVPTFVEQKLPGMQAVTFFSVVAPPGTPPALAATIQKQLAQALTAPDVRQKFLEQGAEPRGWTPEDSGAFIQRETQKWAKVIKTANVTLD